MTVIPRPGRLGCKITQMTTIIANPGGPGRRNLVPRNKCRQKISPLLNHFSLLPEISAQRKGWCPLLSTSGRFCQLLSTFSRLFLAIISKQLLNFIWKNVWSVDLKRFKLRMAQYIRINGYDQQKCWKRRAAWKQGAGGLGQEAQSSEHRAKTRKLWALRPERIS